MNWSRAGNGILAGTACFMLGSLYGWKLGVAVWLLWISIVTMDD